MVGTWVVVFRLGSWLESTCIIYTFKQYVRNKRINRNARLFLIQLINRIGDLDFVLNFLKIHYTHIIRVPTVHHKHDKLFCNEI